MPYDNLADSTGLETTPDGGVSSSLVRSLVREFALVDREITAWRRQLASDESRVVILDDDPTGSQTSSDVDVILEPSRSEIGRFMDGSDRAVFVLTNSRALSEPDAIARVREIALLIDEESKARARPTTILLRGDSTLRGHVFPEIDALGGRGERAVLVPAFPEAGRVTLGGRQLLMIGNRWVPVSQTEFAMDPVFGFNSDRLVDWVFERGGDRACVTVDLSTLRRDGAQAVSMAIQDAGPGGVVVPDAVDRGDLAVIARGIAQSQAVGVPLVVRSAASLASIRAGLDARPIEELNAPGPRLLVVCGSHTRGATEQVEHLVKATGVKPVTLLADSALGRVGLEQAVSDSAGEVAASLRSTGLAILATERHRRVDHGTIEHGAAVMDALVACVARVSSECDLVVAKGGITSAEIARRGLGAVRARVRGQLGTGISVWDIITPWGPLSYVVVPGNVGEASTLTDTIRRVRIG